MDLGTFQRSRARLWAWIALPIALMACATVPTILLRREAQRELALRESLLDSIPAVERRVRRASELLQMVTPNAARHAETTQEATRRLDESANRAGLTLRALKVMEGIETDGAFRVVNMQVQAEGSLKAMALWLDEVQKPGLLMSIRAATINANIPMSTGLYSGEFMIALRLRSP